MSKILVVYNDLKKAGVRKDGNFGVTLAAQDFYAEKTIDRRQPRPAPTCQSHASRNKRGGSKIVAAPAGRPSERL